MSSRRNGLRKQVTEAKEGALELSTEEDTGTASGGKKVEERHRSTPRKESTLGPPF